jgi:hypothetical protein
LHITFDNWLAFGGMDWAALFPWMFLSFDRPICISTAVFVCGQVGISLVFIAFIRLHAFLCSLGGLATNASTPVGLFRASHLSPVHYCGFFPLARSAIAVFPPFAFHPLSKSSAGPPSLLFRSFHAHIRIQFDAFLD